MCAYICDSRFTLSNKDSLSRQTDANTFFALERERERERAFKILARKKWSKWNHSPKEKKLSLEAFER